MGNAEARALAASDHSIMVDAVLQEHQELLSAENREHYVDRARFGLFFDVEKSAVPFRLIDQLFDAMNTGEDPKGIPFAELVIPLMLSMPSVSIEEKFRMMFQCADPSKGQEEQVSVKELTAALKRLLVSNVQRLRGRPGKTAGGTDLVQYIDRRCQGCGEVPTNTAFECRDCFNGHTVLGLPVTTHLCHNCVGSWVGISLCYEMRHDATHRVDQVHRVPNPHTLTHQGVGCAGCGMNPIAGPRYQCTECIDMVDLCEDCHATSESPLGHVNHHRMLVHDRRPLTLEQEVQGLIETLFKDADIEPKAVGDDGFNKVKALIPVQTTMGRDQRAVLALPAPNSNVAAPKAAALAEEQRRQLAAGEVVPMAEKDARYITEETFIEKMLTSEKAISLFTGFDVRHVKLCVFPESIEQTTSSSK